MTVHISVALNDDDPNRVDLAIMHDEGRDLHVEIHAPGENLSMTIASAVGTMLNVGELDIGVVR